MLIISYPDRPPSSPSWKWVQGSSLEVERGREHSACQTAYNVSLLGNGEMYTQSMHIRLPLSHLGHHVGLELLAPEARLDRHDEHGVGALRNGRVELRRQGGAGLERQAGQDPGLTDLGR